MALLPQAREAASQPPKRTFVPQLDDGVLAVLQAEQLALHLPWTALGLDHTQVPVSDLQHALRDLLQLSDKGGTEREPWGAPVGQGADIEQLRAYPREERERSLGPPQLGERIQTVKCDTSALGTSRADHRLLQGDRISQPVTWAGVEDGDMRPEPSIDPVW
jgi:hypothetical protein